MIQVYENKVKNINLKISEHFTLKEYMCKCGCPITFIDSELALRLEILRKCWGDSIIITSGYRCAKHNKAIQKKGRKSVLYSNHQKGFGVDIKLPKTDREMFLSLIADIFPWYYVGKGFVHVDIVKRDVK